jgi:nucleotide-binding universal stress UspA family protein
MYSPDHAFNQEVEEQGREWLRDGLDRVPEGVSSESQLRHAESVTSGLLDAASDPERGEAALIVIGTNHRVRAKRFGVGSLTDTLLHASPVPVALAPSGYQSHSGVSRITCAVGMAPGAEDVLANAIRLAGAWKVPLRVMSLVAVGEDSRQQWTELAQRHAATLAAQADATLGADIEVTSVVGQGDSLGDAVRALDFAADEVVVIGSSRLAAPKRLFVGHSASKIIRALKVPMIVFPRD